MNWFYRLPEVAKVLLVGPLFMTAFAVVVELGEF